MTKKHFIALAALVAAHRDSFDGSCVELLASFCKTQNADFKEDKFVRACGGAR